MISKQERRRFPRLRQSNPVRYSPMGSEAYYDARLVDLGEGGLCMECSTPLRTGSAIYVQIHDLHPEKASLCEVCCHGSFHGTVRWTRDLGDSTCTRYGIGVEFTRSMCQQ
ncbi:MAG: PilZ domain-containing protein [Desulfovibrionales bacterium]|nr:PilZ domain-containing protein [Desulfovibrionales bacterium]